MAKIKLNKFGNVSELTKKGLIEVGLPDCLGNQTPPFVLNTIDIEDDILIRPIFDVTEDDIYVGMKPESFMESEFQKLDGVTKFTISKKGVDSIIKQRDDMISSYVNHLKKCSECKLTDICNKLTKHYIESIKLELSTTLKKEGM